MKNKITFGFLISFVTFCSFGTVFADTTIHLDIESSSGSLYNQDITVTPCDSDNAGTMAVTGYCAVLQSGLSNDWSWFGTDAFLNSIDVKINNDNNNGIYWGWFANLNLGQTALNKYNLIDGDSILLNYDINPLQIEVDNKAPTVGDTIKFTVRSFGFDSSWSPAWNPVTNGKIIIGSDTFDLDTSGEYSMIVTYTNVLTVKGQVTGFIDTPSITVTPVPSGNGGGGGGGNGGGGGGSRQPTFSLTQAISFLSSKQNSNGSLGDILYTDWAAISFASAGNQANDPKYKILDYLKNNSFQSSSVTDNERHSMALMALGVNPYNGTNTNYINKIVSSFDGTQFGDSSLVNDDIFALIVLKNAGYVSSDEIINKDVSYVISHQSSDGSWGGVDMTSSSIQALRNFSDLQGVSLSITQAENYLVNSQNGDGSFGNSFSTSWAIQALSQNSSFSTNVSKADNYIASLQQTDGGVDIVTDPSDNRVWATAYAIPGVLHIPWNSIMQSFNKQSLPIVENTTTTTTPTPPVVVTKPVIVKADTVVKDVIAKKAVKKVKKHKNSLPGETPFNRTANVLSASAGAALSSGEVSYSTLHVITQALLYPFTWLSYHFGF